MRRLIITILLFLKVCMVHTQENISTEQQLSDLLESLTQNDELQENNTQAFENLLDLIQNPVQLNYCNKTDLEEIIFLSKPQIDNLYGYLIQSRPIYSIYQLQGVQDFNQELLQALQHFVGFDTTAPQKSPHHYIKGNFIVRDIINFNNDYIYNSEDSSNAYLGDRHHLYSRFQIHYNKSWSAGFTLDKDAGEQLPGQHPDGIDFTSAYAMYHSNKTIKNLVIGDYQINIGQGLAIWTGTDMGKSSDIFSALKRGKKLNKYTSANESGYLRGTALELQYHNLNLVLFASQKQRDANIESQSDSIILISLPTTGYHRTYNELANKNKLTQSTAGSFIEFNIINLNIYGGAYYNSYGFDSVIIKNDYQRYIAPQKELITATAGYKYTYEKLLFFGETSSTKLKDYATVNGIIFTPQANVSISLLHRYAQIKYNSPFSTAFFENSHPGGESGFYLGINFIPLKHLNLSGYLDVFKHQWIKYRTNAPSSGYDLFINAAYQFTSDFNCYFRYTNKEKMKNYLPDSTNIYQLEKYKTQKIRFHANYMASSSIQFQLRFEKSFYNSSELYSQGFLSFINMKVSLQKHHLNFWMRYTIFNTDNYNARIYAYENDLLYNFSTPAFFYNGSKIYLQGQWKITPPLRFWVKYGHMWYAQTKNGLNYSSLPSTTQTILKMQLQYVF